MTRPRALPATAAMVVATVLTLGVAGMLDLVELPARDVPPLSWLVPDRLETDPDRAAGAGPVPTPGPVPRTDRGPAPGPAPSPSARTSAPLLLHLDSMGVVAPVVRVGVTPEGSMEIPDDIATVGWYATDQRRVSPGDPGTAVIAGHRDSRTQGSGALHDIGLLDRDDTLRVVHLDGRASVWRVERVLLTPRDQLPAHVLYAVEGRPRLALVTCGGEFDRRTRSYSHNVIVLATLVPPEGPPASAYARSR